MSRSSKIIDTILYCKQCSRNVTFTGHNDAICSIVRDETDVGVLILVQCRSCKNSEVTYNTEDFPATINKLISTIAITQPQIKKLGALTSDKRLVGNDFEIFITPINKAILDTTYMPTLDVESVMSKFLLCSRIHSLKLSRLGNAPGDFL